MPRNPKAAKEVPNDAVFISAAQVLRRYGNVSHMWLEHRLRTDPYFPKPMTFTERGWRFFKLEELEAYERMIAARSSMPAA